MISVEDARCWAAVLARDLSQDGRFVYAVRTTGVYCRPSCPSRRAKRENVRFFPAPSAAEEAGFRPCRRCRPREHAATAADAVWRVREFLERHADRPPTLAELGNIAGMSPHHLQRTFKRLVGVSPRQFASALRIERLKAQLRAGRTVSRATYEAGYGASSRVYDDANARLGMTPAAYRRGGAGVLVRFTTTQVELGWLLVAATARGICAVLLGDSQNAVERELASEFPAATRRRVDETADEHADLRTWLASVVARTRGIPAADVPSDTPGTALQERVWAALRDIPTGETRTYAEVARAVGAPKAVRAVASACAGNRIALVVPCHRVVRADGGLAGYRWGLDRKRALLETESPSRRSVSTSIVVRRPRRS